MCLRAAVTRIIKGYAAQIWGEGAQVVAEYSCSVSVRRQIYFGNFKYYQPELLASWISYVSIIPNRSWHYFLPPTYRQLWSHWTEKWRGCAGKKQTEVMIPTQRWIWNTDIDPVLQSGFLFCFTSVNQLKLHSANRLHFPPVNTGFQFHCQ